MGNILKRKTTAVIAPARVNPVLLHPEEYRMSLDGDWRFRLDPEDSGVKKKWYGKPDVMQEKIRVPGSWQGQGFGGDGEEEVWDFRLMARTFRASYHGVGWYGKFFAVPGHFEGKRLWILFGGVHPTANVWVNGRKTGESHCPMVPFGFEVTGLVKPGNQNTVVVRVSEEDRIYGFSWNFQARWSGLYRGVELLATGEDAIGYCRFYPDLESKSVTVKASVDSLKDHAADSSLTVSIYSVDGRKLLGEKSFPVESREISGSISVPEALPWTPDNPSLFRMDAVLTEGKHITDARSERIGFVRIRTEGKHIKIGEEPYYMRGTGDFLHCPETGCPDTDRERWRRKLKVLRDYGYNYVRCQSHVPVPEYMDAADEAGLIVQSEAGMLGAWGGTSQYHIYAWPQPLPAYREHLRKQWNLIVQRDVNHPSANIYCMSNELYLFPFTGHERKKTIFFPRTAWQCYEETKALKPTALVVWTDGVFSEVLPGDFVNAEASVDKKTELPVIQHEFRWWSSFPDVRIIRKYNGALRHWSAEMAKKAAAEKGISHVLAAAARNSQRLQFVEAKGKMEGLRRDYPRLAGICHFDAMDSVASPQGILDEFYDRKYADARTWRQTNGDTVILSSLNFNDRVMTGGQVFRCGLAVSDYSHPAFSKPVIKWKLIVDNKERSSGTINYAHRPFCTCKAGEIKTDIPAVSKPVRAYLAVSLSERGKEAGNRWDLWIFPENVTIRKAAVHGNPQDTWLKSFDDLPRFRQENCIYRILLTERFDKVSEEFARSGGTVLVVAAEGLVRPFYPKLSLTEGRYFFTPPANYGPFEDGNNGTIIRRHPMLGDFPHEGFADLQFYRMIGESPPLDLEPLGLNDGDPVIRAIHLYPLCRPLGYLIERKLGKGSVIISALNMDAAWVEARYLLSQICRYASGRKEKSPVLSGKALSSLYSAGELMSVSIPAKGKRRK